MKKDRNRDIKNVITGMGRVINLGRTGGGKGEGTDKGEGKGKGSKAKKIWKLKFIVRSTKLYPRPYRH